MALQLPGPLNQLSVPAIDRAVQQTEWNALRQQAAQQQFDEATRIDNTKWLVAVGKFGQEQMAKDPQSYVQMMPKIAEEMQRRGMPMAKEFDYTTAAPEEVLQGFIEMQRAGEIGLGGMQQQEMKPTSGIQEYQFAKSQGYQGSFEDWKKQNKGGVTVDARQMGTVPPGYKANYDEEGRIVSLTPIPGGPAEREIQSAEEAEAGKRESQQRSGDLLLDEISRSFERIGPKAGGFLPATGAGGALVRQLPPTVAAATKAQQLDQVVTTLKSNIGFDRLQEMRNNSPTGGALGQVSEMENKLLQATAGNLDPNQPDWMFAYNLGRLYNKYMDVVHGKDQGGSRWQAPETAYRRLYENANSPQHVQDFRDKFGYLPPGFE